MIITSTIVRLIMLIYMLEVKRRADLFVSVQRMVALCIASAYRTGSAAAIIAISDTIPGDLLAAELMMRFIRRSGRTKWQRRWNDEDRGRWTAQLIPDIRPWIGRKFGDVNYYVTQM